MRRISKDITKHYQMACSSAELHAILLCLGYDTFKVPVLTIAHHSRQLARVPPFHTSASTSLNCSKGNCSSRVLLVSCSLYSHSVFHFCSIAQFRFFSLPSDITNVISTPHLQAATLHCSTHP